MPRFFGTSLSTPWTADLWLYEHGEEWAIPEVKWQIHVALKYNDDESLMFFCAIYLRLRELGY